MPKSGKKDSEWEKIMTQYAAGLYHFSTGKYPGSLEWRKVKQNIDKCPRHRNVSRVSVFGGMLKCKCGYHDKDKVSISFM